MKTVTSRAFNRDVSSAKRLARDEPVFVTDRGKPTHVLLGIEAYRQLMGKPEALAERLAAAEPIAAEPDWRALGPWGRRE